MNLLNGSRTVSLVNTKSGGKGGALFVLEKMKCLLGEENVFSLFTGNDKYFFEDTLAFLVAKKPAIVIVAGGDGTLSFVMNCIKSCHDQNLIEPHLCRVAPFPLGTGNDLSCALGFGVGFSKWIVLGNRRFQQALTAVGNSVGMKFDRWSLTVSPIRDNTSESVMKVMNNYFSIGFDAGCAGHMARLREKYPSCFISRPIVKLWYAYTAVVSLFRDGKIGKDAVVKIDGRTLDLPYNPKAIVVSNISSYAGGSSIWNASTDKDRYLIPSPNDGLVEIMCLRGVWHLALVRLNLAFATKLGQGRRVEVEFSSRIPCQYDGEFVANLPLLGNRVRASLQHYTTCEVQQSVPREISFFSRVAVWLVLLFAIVIFMFGY